MSAREHGGWQDETVADLVQSARLIAKHSCSCPVGAHQNALHDLASDVVRILGGVGEHHRGWAGSFTDDGRNGPPSYCIECSAAISDWVPWPCVTATQEVVQ